MKHKLVLMAAVLTILMGCFVGCDRDKANDMTTDDGTHTKVSEGISSAISEASSDVSKGATNVSEDLSKGATNVSNDVSRAMD